MGFISEATKANYAWKKFLGKQHTSNDKAAYEEESGLLTNVHSTNIWTGEIPTVAPADTANNTVIKKVSVTMTEDKTVSGRKSFYAEENGSKLNNWISAVYDRTYAIVLYINGTKIPSSDASRWTFDYENGVLWFENTPTSGSVVVEGYVYIGEHLSDSIGGDSTKIKGGSEVEGDLTIDGDLIVNGTTTTINTEELTISDNIITLNAGTTGAPTENAGLEVDRGDEGILQLIQWDETSDTAKIYNAELGALDTVITNQDMVNLRTELAENTVEGDDGANDIGYAGRSISDNGHVVLTAGTVAGGIGQLAQIIDDMKEEDATSFHNGIQGDTTAETTYVITHNLDSDTNFLDVKIYGYVSGKWINMMVPYEMTDTNNITVELSEALPIKYTISIIG